MTDPRVRILQAAIEHTAQARPSVYGKPHPNMSAQMALVDAYLDHSKGRNGRAHEMAIISLLIKIGRIASGSYHSDNYEDGAAYLAIAGECAEIERAKVGGATNDQSVSEVPSNLRSLERIPEGHSEDVSSGSPLHEQEVRSTILRSG